MAQTPEGKVKDKIKKLFKDRGVWYFMPVQTGYSTPGVPDFVGCYHGRFLGVEAKAGKNKPTPAQKLQLKLIGQADGVTLVVNEDNLDELQAYLDNIEKGDL